MHAPIASANKWLSLNNGGYKTTNVTPRSTMHGDPLSAVVRTSFFRHLDSRRRPVRTMSIMVIEAKQQTVDRA